MREAPKEKPDKTAALWDTARNKTHMGRLQATGTVIKALHRMQVLATRKARQISCDKRVFALFTDTHTSRTEVSVFVHSP